jgi:hypothetical protein
MSLVYVDTSVLAKRYLRGPDPDDVGAWLAEPAHRRLGRAAMNVGLRVKSFQAQVPASAPPSGHRGETSGRGR